MLLQVSWAGPANCLQAVASCLELSAEMIGVVGYMPVTHQQFT